MADAYQHCVGAQLLLGLYPSEVQCGRALHLTGERFSPVVNLKLSAKPAVCLLYRLSLFFPSSSFLV